MNISWFSLTDACFDAAEQLVTDKEQLKASVHPPETGGTACGFGVNDYQEIFWLFKCQQKLLTCSQHQTHIHFYKTVKSCFLV